jgi:hypothetical protein
MKVTINVSTGIGGALVATAAVCTAYLAWEVPATPCAWPIFCETPLAS